MKILHINCNYIGTTLHQIMIEKLSNLGLENKVYVPTFDVNTSVIIPNQNVIVSECFKKWDRIIFDYKQKKISNDIQSKIKISEFDCIHAYTLFSDGNIAMKLSKKYGVPYVVAIRNTDVNTFFKMMIHLRSRGVEIMRNAAAIFFLSESYCEEVFEKYIPKKYYVELKNKTHIIPNGIDDFWLKNKLREKLKSEFNKEIKLLYVGKIDKNKNIQTTQKVVNVLRKKGYNISLSVVGKIVDKNEFKKIIKDKSTRYTTPKSKEELIKIYRNNDIFIMPSFKETFGLVYAEAMSQGLPIIYTKNQGFDKQFKEGLVGYHVDPNQIQNIVENVIKIIKNYENLSRNSVKYVEYFNWNKICKKYYSIYKKVKFEM